MHLQSLVVVTLLMSVFKNAACMLPTVPSSRVVILGGGLQGCATAYYLKQQHGFTDITIVERTSIAAAASGKGGGFLARGWGRGSPTQQLHEVSFDLHEQLAKDLSLKSYRKIPTLSVTGELGGRRAKAGPAPWLDASRTAAKVMDPDTAQVVPLELCTRLFEESGAKLVTAAARGLVTAADGDEAVRVTGVEVGDAAAPEVVPCDVVLGAMGAWTVLLEDWLSEATGLSVPLEGGDAQTNQKHPLHTAVHGPPFIPSQSSPAPLPILNAVYSSSIVYSGTQEVAAEPYALFCAEDSNSCHLECYPRVDGSIYLCGIGGSDYVRGARLREGGDLQDASMMAANPARVAAARASFEGLAPSVAVGQAPMLEQACMRPCAPDAMPLLGLVRGTSNVVLACGHNCWGIREYVIEAFQDTSCCVTFGLGRLSLLKLPCVTITATAPTLASRTQYGRLSLAWRWPSLSRRARASRLTSQHLILRASKHASRAAVEPRRARVSASSGECCAGVRGSGAPRALCARGRVDAVTRRSEPATKAASDLSRALATI